MSQTVGSIRPDQFRCDACKGVFDREPESDWTEEERVAELSGIFPSVTTDECGIVCDDCYKKMGFG